MLMFTARRTRSVSRQRTRVLNRELAHQPCIESPRADSFSISALCQRTRVLNRELCIESPSSRAHQPCIESALCLTRSVSRQRTRVLNRAPRVF